MSTFTRRSLRHAPKDARLTCLQQRLQPRSACTSSGFPSRHPQFPNTIMRSEATFMILPWGSAHLTCFQGRHIAKMYFLHFVCCNVHYLCRGWGIAYNSLLSLHAKTGQAEQAENVYQGMLLHGPSPNRNSINSTIAAFAAVRCAPCCGNALPKVACFMDGQGRWCKCVLLSRLWCTAKAYTGA